MGNYKNPNAIDIIISGADTMQGCCVVGATVTGKYSELHAPLNNTSGVALPSSLNINATVAGRPYAKYNATGKTINYYQ